MTTKLIIKNAATSNGDVNVRVRCGSALQAVSLTPGKKHEAWISTGHEVSIDETWPTQTQASDREKACELADDLIAKEARGQENMWGDQRADGMENELIHAAQAQLSLTNALTEGVDPARATALALLEYYPKNWDGFRSYGSNVANLVVAAAFIRNEIARRITLGEDTTRSQRTEPYTKAAPKMTAEEALALG